MSRGYQVTWETVTGAVTSGDTMHIKLSVLGVLSSDEMCGLLRDELARDGWTEAPDGTMTLEVGDATARVPPDGSEIAVTLTRTTQVQSGGVSRQAAEEALAGAKARTEEALRAESAKRLMKLEPDLRQRVNEALQRVYLEALRKKAASMGEIESVVEGLDADGAMEVTIKVRV